MLSVEFFEFHESIFGLSKVNILLSIAKDYFSSCRLVMQLPNSKRRSLKKIKAIKLIKAIKIFNKNEGKMKKILEKSGKGQGISSEEKSGNPGKI